MSGIKKINDVLNELNKKASGFPEENNIVQR